MKRLRMNIIESPPRTSTKHTPLSLSLEDDFERRRLRRYYAGEKTTKGADSCNFNSSADVKIGSCRGVAFSTKLRAFLAKLTSKPATSSSYYQSEAGCFALLACFFQPPPSRVFPVCKRFAPHRTARIAHTRILKR